MANRHLLAVNKLEDFKNWLIGNDWQIEKPKGNYEVLRARKDTERLPLIVYKKDKDGLIHLSVSDWNTKYVYEFINDNKSNKQTALKSQLDQQRAMWDKLKEWVKENKYKQLDDRYIEQLVDVVNIKCLLDKMQELEAEDVED